jgi:hypothetical protein
MRRQRRCSSSQSEIKVKITPAAAGARKQPMKPQKRVQLKLSMFQRSIVQNGKGYASKPAKEKKAASTK